MGLDVTSYTVVGLRIDTTGRKRRIRAFDHDYPEDWKVDPKSGRPLWREVSAIDGIDGLETVRRSCEDDGEVVFGRVIGETGSDEGMGLATVRPADVLEVAAEVRGILEGVGLLTPDNEAQFGVWTVTHYSH